MLARGLRDSSSEALKTTSLILSFLVEKGEDQAEIFFFFLIIYLAASGLS